ncbi:MAG: fibronectin type III domain-containing protein [Candidatus Palauibacterales bacterium]|nr:fibronectin type III domain-containing protein [Candidatus Palauibacterales bacterium]
MRRIRHRTRRVAALLATIALFGAPYACSPEGPEGGLPTHPSDGFTITLEWDAPTQDAAGQPLTDLGGFRLYYSPSLPPSGAEGIRIDIGLDTRATVTGLPAGRYYFGVTAVDLAGNESDLSDPLEVEVGP